MPVDEKRSRTLYGIGAKRDRVHRYTRIRWTVGVLFTVGIALLPATGAMRFDFWSGSHRVLGEEVGLVEAAKAFAFPFLAVNVAILVATRFLGRWLCGFVCPIGNLNRLTEWIRWSRRSSRAARVRGALWIFLVSLLLAAITFSFWVDWRVFAHGTPLAIGLATSFLLGTTLVIFGSIWFLGMRFCSHICPSGIYFALLGPKSATGVEFANPENCTECKACVTVCPVNLEPTKIRESPPRPGLGLYPDGLTSLANCLRCGDCVSVCEETGAGASDATPLRLGFLRSDERSSASANGSVGGGGG